MVSTWPLPSASRSSVTGPTPTTPSSWVTLLSDSSNVTAFVMSFINYSINSGETMMNAVGKWLENNKTPGRKVSLNTI